LLEQDVCLISEWKNVQIEEMNIQKDHIHLVVLFLQNDPYLPVWGS